MSTWQLQPIFDQYGVVLLIGMTLLGCLWFIRPAFSGVTRYRWRILAALRGAVIVILLVLAVRPMVLFSRTRVLPQSVVFLVDTSRSMTVADESGGVTRWDALRQCVDQVRSTGIGVPETNLRTVLFAEGAQAPAEGLMLLRSQRPSGPQSDLGGAILATLDGLASEDIRAIVLLSDGAQRAVRPAADAERMARELSRRGIALIAVPFGKARDQSQSRDVAVESLPERASVYVKNQLSVIASLRFTGFAGQDIPVHTLLQKGHETPRLVDVRQVSVGESTEPVSAELKIQVDEPGEYVMTVEVEPQEGELVTTNNRQICFVRVQEGGLNILYVEGNPLRREFQALVRAWRESPDIQLEPMVLSRRLRDKWPLPLPENKFDVYVLGDVEAASFDRAWLERMRSHVEQGSGFLSLGGFHTMGPGQYAGTPVDQLLPIRMEDLERQPSDPQAPIRDDIQLQGELALIPQREHPIFRIEDQANLQEMWRRMPPLEGALKWSGLKPDAIVLGASSASEPLLVAGQHGEGHVLAFAGYSTWRWQSLGFVEQHRRFWRQVLLWLAQRDDIPGQRLRVALNRQRVNVGAEIQGDVMWDERVSGEAGESGSGLVVRGTVRSDGGSATEVPVGGSTPMAGGVRNWTIKPPTGSVGMHELQVNVERDGKVLESVTTRYLVADRDLELEDPSANPAFLERLSRHTEANGGKLSAAEQLSESLAELFQTPREQQNEILDRWQLGDRAIDAWIAYAVSVGCLTAEWMLRKKWGGV